MNLELNGLIIEPEVAEEGEIGGATEIAVDVLYRSGEKSVSLVVELEGMCKSLVEIVAEEGHVYVDIYRDWSQERPERIEICRYYYRGKEPGTSGVASPRGESNAAEATPENVEEDREELHDDHQSAQ